MEEEEEVEKVDKEKEEVEKKEKMDKEAEKMEEEELGLAAEMIWTDDWICLVSNSWRSGRWRSCQ